VIIDSRLSPYKKAHFAGWYNPGRMFRTRYRHILWFFGRLIIAFIWWDIFLPQIGLRRLARRTRPQRLQKAARAFRGEAIRLGGVMIKVGQFMSARLDVLPQEITDELSGLQDEVRAEAYQDIRRVIESEFSTSLEEKYIDFETSPVASASIGQVHRAHLVCQDTNQTGGEKQTLAVVVKVQRPHIEEIVKVDLAALRVVGGWLYRYPPLHKRANVPGLLEEFSRSLYEEIDYLHEGKNAEVFARNFKERHDIRVPAVHWSHTTRRVLTLEDVQSIKITDYAAIEAAGIDRAEVATRMFDAYLKQIFEDHFFHADPHPGNLFIHPLMKNGEVNGGSTTPWELVFVDFGMTGQLTPNVQEGLREMLIGVGTRDGARVVKSFQTLDALLPTADIHMLEKAASRVFESFWGKTAPEMMQMHQEEALKFAREFRGLMYEMPFQVPENMILLGRCVSILSGICTGLYPGFNIWTSMAPYAQKLIQTEGGGTWRVILQEVVSTLQVLIALPKKTEALLNRIEQGNLEVRDPELQYRMRRVERGQNQLIKAVLFSAFLLGGIQVYLAGDFLVAGGLGLSALITLVWLFF
jgi:predicted unusual protein kinase regulating ubiquinone biosynthesis (AarF/ABC1/UbiB family)